jgi:pyridoxamine 5'-phosphate oxidase
MYDEAELLRWSELPAIHENIWATLVRGAANRKDEFHTPTIATVRSGSPELRTVVLRKAVEDERELWFHTDVRSEKVADIRANPSLAWHFYHSSKQLQLRIRSRAEVVPASDEISVAQWSKTQLLSRRGYCGDDIPGAAVESMSTGLPDFLQDREPTLEESEAGRKNFMVVRCVVEEIEWLLLHYSGHRRAAFTYGNSSSSSSSSLSSNASKPVLASSTWLVP